MAWVRLVACVQLVARLQPVVGVRLVPRVQLAIGVQLVVPFAARVWSTARVRLVVVEAEA